VRGAVTGGVARRKTGDEGLSLLEKKLREKEGGGQLDRSLGLFVGALGRAVEVGLLSCPPCGYGGHCTDGQRGRGVQPRQPLSG
jgi:hypothetical protein